MTNSIALQTFITYSLKNIINVKSFAEFTNQDNAISTGANTYNTRTDRTLWLGFGLNKDFYLNNQILNIAPHQEQLAITLLTDSISSIAMQRAGLLSAT